MKKRYYLFALALLPKLALAQTVNDIMSKIMTLLQGFITLCSLTAFATFFWGIAIFIYNVDDDKKRGEGKDWMVWSIVALFVMITVWGILGFLTGTFNISPLPLLPLGA